jgi:hypothetical protein
VSNISSSVSGNTSLLAEYITYHFINGNFQNTSANTSSGGGTSGSGCSFSPVVPSTQTTSITASASALSTATVFERLFGRQTNSSNSFPQIFSGIFPNVTLGRTLLNSSDLVMLEGNKSQVLAWTRNSENGNVTILNQVYVYTSNSSLFLPAYSSSFYILCRRCWWYYMKQISKCELYF